MEDWFEDKRKGLHCCFCNSSYENAVGVKLYNHKIYQHIVCETCLRHLKEISLTFLEKQKEELLTYINQIWKKYNDLEGVDRIIGKIERKIKEIFKPKNLTEAKK